MSQVSILILQEGIVQLISNVFNKNNSVNKNNYRSILVPKGKNKILVNVIKVAN